MVKAQMNKPFKTPASADRTPALLREQVGRIVILTLNRPRSRNTLTESMLANLRSSFAEIASDAGLRAVVIASKGPVFSAGHDLKEMTGHRDDPDGGRGYFQQLMETCSAMMQEIVGLPQPVIAAVEGTATAAGCQLVAACDLAIASSTAKFGTSGINVGLFCSTPMVALSRKVARKHAMEMLLTGDLISAEHALRFGLVNRVVAPGRALDEALALAKKIASKSRIGIQLGKRAFYQQIEMPLAEAYRLTTEVIVRNLLESDAKEGIGAFIDKRDPKFNDR
jgi:enoyl-CoA hydratase/carnithine racemase